jgi:lipopolysaccharide transport system permease protein
VPSDGVAYPLFAYAGILPWTLLSAGITASATSLVGSPNLVTKVYFPRMIIPGAAVLSGVADFLIASVGLAYLMARYGGHLSWNAVALVPTVALVLLLASGVGGWLSAINVKYRDVRYIVPFFMQLWMFATPVIYSTTLVPPKWRFLMALNPMASYIDAFRSVCFGRALDWTALGLSTIVTCGLLMLAARTFRSLEQSFADYI